MGYCSILYLAVITGIDHALYESATLDGAGKFKMWIHITIPSIMSTNNRIEIVKRGCVKAALFF